jgi:hypothetical protein
MLGKILTAKHSELDSPIMDAQINDVPIPNTLIELGITINVMTKEIVEIHGLSDL